MASTAANGILQDLQQDANVYSLNSGVAVGSSIGHAIGGFFSGGSSAPEAAAPVQAQQTNNSEWGNNCGVATTNFTKCMDDHSGNMQICGWYLEQLKACQAAATQYTS
ncbi:hypothetical protein G7054_g5200 [Neopestalotiopsis clavispora]|nr:hypothetical protein G7054_g5200 [Neopestalotiopsis clavispora]